MTEHPSDLELSPAVERPARRSIGVWWPAAACVVVLVAAAAGAASAAGVGSGADALATATVDSGWSLFASYGPLWGSVALAYRLLHYLLTIGGGSGWLARGRALAALTGAVAVLGTALQWHFEGAPAEGVLVALVGAIALILHPTVHRRAAEAGVAVLVALAVAAATPACAARQAVGAGVAAGLDCEAPGIRAYLADATTLAIEVVVHWISGSGQVDRDGLASDAAKIRTDLGRCALDAAVAAVAARGARSATDPLAPKAAPMVVDATQLASTYAEIRAALGWPAERAGGDS